MRPRIPRHIKFWMIGVPVLAALFAAGIYGSIWLSNQDSASAASGGVITVKGHTVKRTVTTPAHTITRNGKTIHVPATTRVSTHFQPGRTTILPASTIIGAGGTKTIVRTIPGPAGPTTTVVRTVTGPGGVTTQTVTVTGPTVPGPTVTVPGPTTTVPGPTVTVTVTVPSPPTS
jgi:hypothetical protein